MADRVAANEDRCPSCGGDAGDNWFDRSLCPCDDIMHTRCSNCGAALDGCEFEKEARSLLQRAADEWLGLSLMSYHGGHGMAGDFYADLTEDEIKEIQTLIRQLAEALAAATGEKIPTPEFHG